MIRCFFLSLAAVLFFSACGNADSEQSGTQDGDAETIEIAERHAFPFPLAADPDRRVAERCGLASGGLLIADQWGELFLVEPMPDGAHSYPAPAEVAEWLRFVAIQCPECENPEGEWRTL